MHPARSRLPTRRVRLRGAVALVLVAGCSAKEPSGERPSPSAEVLETVDAVLEAYGGKAALEGVDAFRSEGLLVSHRGEQGTMVRWFERPDRLRVEIRYPDRGELRIVSGEAGWTGSSDRALQPATTSFLDSMRLQAGRLDLPIRLLEGVTTLVTLAPDEKKRIVLGLPLDDHLFLDYHIHPKSHRIERVEMVLAGEDTLRFGVTLGEFRWIEGVLFPFKEDLDVSGEPTSTYLCSDVEVNPRVPVRLFGEEPEP